MNRLSTILLAGIIILVNAVGSMAQAWQYSEEFGTDFFTSQLDRKIEVVNCNTGSREMKSVGICMRKDVANGFAAPSILANRRPNTDGLYGKVASGVAAQRPGRGGKNYNYNTSQKHRDWVKQKQARDAEARERRRAEAIRKKIEEDNRVAAATAAANAKLQGETNRRIQNDRYNAGQGAHIARQQARQAIRTVGPQFNSRQTSAADKAKLLRRQHKPRRVMYPQNAPRNTARKQLARVERKPLTVEQSLLLKKALMVRAELRRKAEAEKAYENYKGIKLTDKAVSTLGRDWHSDDFKTGPLAPPPFSRRPPQYVEPEWLTKHKEMLEMLGEPPLTSEEEIRLLKNHEFLGV